MNQVKKTKKEGATKKTVLDKPELAIIFLEQYKKSKIAQLSDTEKEKQNKRDISDFYDKWYPKATFLGDDTDPTDPTDEKLKEMIGLIHLYNNQTNTPYNKLNLVLLFYQLLSIV